MKLNNRNQISGNASKQITESSGEEIEKVLSCSVTSAIVYLEFTKKEYCQGVRKVECKFVPIIFNKDFTRFKDILTGKIYTTILNKTIVHHYDKDLIEFKEIDGEVKKVVKYTNKILKNLETEIDNFNKVNDINNFYNWKSYYRCVDYSAIKKDYNMIGADLEFYEKPFQMQYDVSNILKKKGEVVPEILDYQNIDYTLQGIKEITKVCEDIKNKQYQENYENGLKAHKELEENLKNSQSQIETYRNF